MAKGFLAGKSSWFSWCRDPIGFSWMCVEKEMAGDALDSVKVTFGGKVDSGAG